MSYAALTAIASDFDALPKTLDAADAAKRIAAIREALDKTATEIGERVPGDEVEREKSSRLFRGFLAAGRIVASVQEKRAESANA